MQAQTLLSVPIGGAATVAGIRGGGAMRRRLMDLGLTAHATVEHLFDAPSGNPRAYQIRGTVIALRNDDAAAVDVWPSGNRGDDAWV